jgi:2-polyprenyl-6-methoxyphenol hydroxylase-like FAD-dependent oxidoreductase
MKILIVGAGIGGLTLAAFLQDSNIEYEIIEKSTDWNHQGFSLSLWNNGRHILCKLGLQDIFDKNSTRINDYYIYNGKGKLIRKYSLSDFYSSYGIALNLTSRADLHNWLIGKVDQSKIQMNTSVEEVVQKDNKSIVRFSTGETQEYDLVVGADGIHSNIRHLVFGGEIKASNVWRVWYMWVPNKFNTKATVTEYVEPGAFISLFDSGEKTLAIIAGLSNHIIWDDPKGRIERLKNTFKSESVVVPHIFETLKDEEINPADLMHVRLKTWVKDKVVLLGDAAHGFEPHAGIGGSMAMEDGYVLAAELMKVSDSYSLQEALKKYEKQRKRRVDIAYRLTWKMKTWGLIRSKVLRRFINFCAPFFPESYFVKDYNTLLKEEI